MTVEMVIMLQEKEGAYTVVSAIEAYKSRLQASIERVERRLGQFEAKYQVTTQHFLQEVIAEDLEGGDLEYVEWAGEAKQLAGLKRELAELENARVQLP